MPFGSRYQKAANLPLTSKQLLTFQYCLEVFLGVTITVLARLCSFMEYIAVNWTIRMESCLAHSRGVQNPSFQCVLVFDVFYHYGEHRFQIFKMLGVKFYDLFL